MSCYICTEKKDIATTIKTPRGNFNVQEIFKNNKEAREAGYYFYFSHETYDIYTIRPDPEREHHTHFGVVIR